MEVKLEFRYIERWLIYIYFNFLLFWLIVHIYFGMILMYMLIGVILLTVSPFSILTKSDSSTKYLKAYKNNVGI